VSGKCPSMVAFFKQNPAVCEPCTLVPLVQWYSQAAEEAGRSDLVQALEDLANDAALTGGGLAARLDKVTDQADGPLRARLEMFKCEAQELIKSM